LTREIFFLDASERIAIVARTSSPRDGSRRGAPNG